MIQAIADVAEGRRALSPDVAAQAIALARINEHHGQTHGLDTLTPREFDVLRMLMAPMNVGTIASTLHLSEKTVNNLHYQIKRKLDAANDIELTKVALSWFEGR